MTMNGMLHRRANVLMLFLPSDTGDRRLTLIKETIETKEHIFSDYFIDTNKGNYKFPKSVEMEDIKKEYKNNIKKNQTIGWTEKPLHGQNLKLVAQKQLQMNKKWIHEERQRGC